MGRILVIEDDASVSYLLRMVLERADHEVLVADDASRGLAMAQRRAPDIILLDIMMPLMDGFAVLEALREDERTDAIPVLVVTAVAKESVEERCLRLGARAFIRKPFDPDVLVETVRELLAAPLEHRPEQVAGSIREVPIAVTLASRGDNREAAAHRERRGIT
jgi:two-component system alkaline phosphatase synthesis response regulator PhoP